MLPEKASIIPCDGFALRHEGWHSATRQHSNSMLNFFGHAPCAYWEDGMGHAPCAYWEDGMGHAPCAYWEDGMGQMKAEQGSRTVKSSLSLTVPSSDWKQGREEKGRSGEREERERKRGGGERGRGRDGGREADERREQRAEGRMNFSICPGLCIIKLGVKNTRLSPV